MHVRIVTRCQQRLPDNQPNTIRTKQRGTDMPLMYSSTMEMLASSTRGIKTVVSLTPEQCCEHANNTTECTWCCSLQWQSPMIAYATPYTDQAEQCAISTWGLFPTWLPNKIVMTSLSVPLHDRHTITSQFLLMLCACPRCCQPISAQPVACTGFSSFKYLCVVLKLST